MASLNPLDAWGMRIGSLQDSDLRSFHICFFDPSPLILDLPIGIPTGQADLDDLFTLFLQCVGRQTGHASGELEHGLENTPQLDHDLITRQPSMTCFNRQPHSGIE